MVTSKDFVDSSIAHQLGAHVSYDMSLDPAAFAFGARASSGMTLSWDHAGQSVRNLNDWQPSSDVEQHWLVQHNQHSKNNKTTHSLRDVLAAGADFDFLLDMQDHRHRVVVDSEGRAAPLINFNRLQGCRCHDIREGATKHDPRAGYEDD